MSGTLLMNRSVAVCLTVVLGLSGCVLLSRTSTSRTRPGYLRPVKNCSALFWVNPIE